MQFSQMLINHKNFHFPQITDKPNDVIFLKSPKTMFLGHFWLFLVIFAWWGFFPKKSGSVSYNYIWASNNMLSFRKKVMSQSRENLPAVGRADRRTDLSSRIYQFHINGNKIIRHAILRVWFLPSWGHFPHSTFSPQPGSHRFAHLLTAFEKLEQSCII